MPSDLYFMSSGPILLSLKGFSSEITFNDKTLKVMKIFKLKSFFEYDGL